MRPQDAGPPAVHRLILVIAIGAVLLSAGAARASDDVLPASATEERIDQGGMLSDEFELSRWANAFRRAPIRRRPAASSRMITRLRYQTEDGFPEVYLTLRSLRDRHGRVWIRLRIPMRPNGRTGWVRREDLGPLHVVRTYLRIDTGRLTAVLYRRGKRVWSSRVGVGKASTPTPRGRFWIRERLRSLGGAYGPWAFGTSAYSATLTEWPGGGVVGIHGTDQPHLIPGRPSHGCVRVPNHKIVRLKRLMPIGTPVRVY